MATLTSPFRNPQSAIRNRLDALAQQHPDWRSWLTLLEATLREMDGPIWAEIEIRLRSDRAEAAPLLDGAELAVDGRRARNWVQHLMKTAAKGEASGAASLTATDLDRLDALVLLEAAGNQDYTRLQSLADNMSADLQALEAIAQLAVMPLLQAGRQHLAEQISPTWPHGYCPVCGAWPTLVELRGLERTLRLRCARCGGDWEATWLRCVFCGETEYRQLGFLFQEGKEETSKVETCATCKGYLKTLTTLQGSSPHEVALEDLATVELDLVALERGYTRPARPGYPLHLRLVERPSRLRTLFGRRR
jgi:FdhE protein